MKIIRLAFLLALTDIAFAQVEIKYLNKGYIWVKVPSKHVKARMTHPKEDLVICWIEIKTKQENFDFITRRAVPVDECMHIVSESRKLLSKNTEVEIIGNGGMRERKGEYFSMFELIRSDKKCIGYFGGCETFEISTDGWTDWKSNPIDPKLYP
jgi:hypothetical protein